MPQKKQPPPSLEDAAAMFDRGLMMTTVEIAVYLRTSTAQLDLYASRGGGPVFIKSGNHRLYDPKDVQAWLDSRRFSATGVPLAVGEEPAA